MKRALAIPVLRKLKAAPREHVSKGQQVSDADVLALRKLHEVDGQTAKEIVLDHPQYSEGYVRSVLSYNRRKGAGRP